MKLTVAGISFDHFVAVWFAEPVIPKENSNDKIATTEFKSHDIDQTRIEIVFAKENIEFVAFKLILSERIESIPRTCQE